MLSFYFYSDGNGFLNFNLPLNNFELFNLFFDSFTFFLCCFDLSFHLLVVLILLNIFLGIIVDAFGELRNKNWQTEKDKKSICFICQLSSDNCLARNVDFQKHVLETHNLWNYVYFLTYLELGNPNDFTRVEGYVWEKLGNQDYSWLPLEGNND